MQLSKSNLVMNPSAGAAGHPDCCFILIMKDETNEDTSTTTARAETLLLWLSDNVVTVCVTFWRAATSSIKLQLVL